MERAAAALADAVRWVFEASHLVRADELPAVVDKAARILGAVGATIFVVDYDQLELVPLVPAGATADSVAVDGTLAGRAFCDAAILQSESGLVWVPMLDGTERVGVLQFDLADDDRLDEERRRDLASLATLFAELVATRSSYGDAIERARRRTPLTVPAELQWRLLPPLTFITPRVAIAGILAPATEVAGDSFDYAVNGDIAHIAVVDAMGHGLEATLLAAVAIGALRNARRAGLPLVETVRLMDDLITTSFSPDKFVTAVVGELDTASGLWRWITCGHPAALLVRQGKVVKELDGGRVAPLGLLPADLPVAEERLEPGDRLFLYTDGVVEARNAAGEFFGTERLVDFVTKEAASGRPAPEALRRLSLAILAYQEGALQDDATTVMVEWLGDEPQRSAY